MLRPWIKVTVPLELYPSRFVGSDYVGADCLLTPKGDDAALDTRPVLSVLPSDYLTSNAAYLEDLAAYAVAEGRTDEEGAAFARWVISSEILTFGVYGSAYEQWVRSLTCTMTARYAVLTYSRMNGAALRLECGCGQRHPGRPWEGATVWNDEGCHYRSSNAVPPDRVADLITARGYQVAGEWSHGDVVRRVAVEPTALPGAETAPTVAAPDAPPSDPGTAEAWESDGGACPGVEPPHGPGPTATTGPQEPEPTGNAPAAPPAAPSADEVAELPKNGRRLVEAATASGWDVTVTTKLMQGVRTVTVSGEFPVRTGTQGFTPGAYGRRPLLEVRLAAQRPPRRGIPRRARVGARRARRQPRGQGGWPDRVGTGRGRVAPPARRRRLRDCRGSSRSAGRARPGDRHRRRASAPGCGRRPPPAPSAATGRPGARTPDRLRLSGMRCLLRRTPPVPDYRSGNAREDAR
ncbi:hypothetical protein [Streptomyces sp. NPDC057557]|uniref:hypothetical protein n=1 Tax=Streptomyces sp. NPDC057557 TaxID=3346167 RepID=UPI003674FF52